MKPKLLIVADTYYPKVDGILRFMNEFLSRCADTFSISLLVPYLGQKKGGNVTYVFPSNLVSLSGYPNMKLSWANFQRIKDAVRKSDLIFIQGPAFISILAMYYGHKFNKKTISYIHVIGWTLFEKFLPSFIRHFFTLFFKRFSIMLYNLCDVIIVPYPSLKEYLHAEGVKANISVARLGVNIETFSMTSDKRKSKEKMGIPAHKKVIGYVGRISKEKNVQALLNAFKKLHHKDVILLIVGDGPPEQKKPFLETQNCRVTGFVNNVEEYLKAMDIFVMPSHTETTSLATLEAMAAGLPVIVTKVGFMKSYITKDYNGIFAPRNSPAVLAAKIDKLLRNKDLQAQLGMNARKTIAYSFSWERSINKIKRILLNSYN